MWFMDVFSRFSSFPPVMIWVPLLLMCCAAVYDLRSRTIPDWVPGALLTWGLLATALGWSGVPWLGVLSGVVIGFLLGLPLFAAGAFGGGDVKLVAALGAALGPMALLATLFWVAVAGGVLSVIALWRGRRDLAYVPAIALGLLVYSVRLELARHVLLS